MSQTLINHIDCHGILTLLEKVSIENNGKTWLYNLGSSRSVGDAFHFGLFANKEAHSDAVNRYPREQRICALIESPINPCYRDFDSLEAKFPLIFTHQVELLERGAPYQELYFGTNWVGDDAIHRDTQEEKDLPVKAVLEI